MTLEELQAKVIEQQDKLKEKDLTIEKNKKDYESITEENNTLKKDNAKLIEKNQDLFLRLTTPIPNDKNNYNNTENKTHNNIEVKPLTELIENINK